MRVFKSRLHRFLFPTYLTISIVYCSYQNEEKDRINFKFLIYNSSKK